MVGLPCQNSKDRDFPNCSMIRLSNWIHVHLISVATCMHMQLLPILLTACASFSKNGQRDGKRNHRKLINKLFYIYIYTKIVTIHKYKLFVLRNSELLWLVSFNKLKFHELYVSLTSITIWIPLAAA